MPRLSSPVLENDFKWQILGIISTGSLILLFFVIGKIVPSVNNLFNSYFSQSTASAQTASLSFPKDHGPHATVKTEWWYFNTLNRYQVPGTTATQDIGYLLSFSRIGTSQALLVSRYNKETNTFSEQTHTGVLTTSLSDNLLRLKFSSSDGTIMRVTQSSTSRFTIRGYTAQTGTVDFAVTSANINRPLLWGCTGNISVFAPNDTFYYSIPNLATTGSVVDIDGKTKTVQKGMGMTWMDHQWFNTMPPSDWVGHYWVNLRANTGDHIGFVTQKYGSGYRYSNWVRLSATGVRSCGTGGTASVTSYWGNGYPAQMRFQLPLEAGKLTDFNALSLSDNQVFRPPIGPTFFEPSSYFSGRVNNVSTQGVGFFETHLKR